MAYRFLVTLPDNSRTIEVMAGWHDQASAAACLARCYKGRAIIEPLLGVAGCFGQFAGVER